MTEQLNDLIDSVLQDNGLVPANQSDNTPVETNGSPSNTADNQPMETNSDLIPNVLDDFAPDEVSQRFSGTSWYSEVRKLNVILAGIGGIGSHAAFQIARLGVNSLTLYDPDNVETVNLAGQLYRFSDVGLNKAQVMGTFIRERCSYDTSVYSVNAPYTATSAYGAVMVCGFDNMSARKTAYQNWIKHWEKEVSNNGTAIKKKLLFIDGRLSVDTLQVFCITGDNKMAMDKYCEKFLFSDSEAVPAACSTKQTTYLASMIGSVITNLIVNFAANKIDNVWPYELPFLTVYDATRMDFEIYNPEDL